MKTYEVKATRSGEWWSLSVPDVPGAFSQSRTLARADEMIADAISLLTDEAPDSFAVVVTRTPEHDRRPGA